MQISAKIDDAPLRHLAWRFPKQAPGMISRAINKTGIFARKRVVQELRKRVINVKSGELKRRNIILKKGNRSTPAATITVKGGRIPLIQFSASETKSGVTYRIKPGGGRAKIHDAFIARVKGPGGHLRLGVAARSTDQRLPIRELYGPSVPQAMEDARVLQLGLHGEITSRLEKEAASQVQYVLSRS